MRSLKLLFILFFVGVSIQALANETLVLIGHIPGRYFERQNPETTLLGFVEIQHRVIQKVGLLKQYEISLFSASI